MTDIHILSGARTAIGSFGGSLAGTPPIDLAAHAARTALDRAGIAPDRVGTTVFGHVINTEPRDMYLSRVAAFPTALDQETARMQADFAAGAHPAQRRLAIEELLAHHLSLRRQRIALQAYHAPPLDGPDPECVQGYGETALAEVDALLAQAGSDKDHLLNATIYLKDIDAHFEGMNSVWDQWLPKGAAPARATVEAKMAKPSILVEISIVAALPQTIWPMPRTVSARS